MSEMSNQKDPKLLHGGWIEYDPNAPEITPGLSSIMETANAMMRREFGPPAVPAHKPSLTTPKSNKGEPTKNSCWCLSDRW